MMPNPLDVAFAALGNDRALALLDSELGKFAGYPGALEGARILSDAHGAEFWNANLYNLWLSSLRALSPGADVGKPASLGMPEVTGTEAWGRRILNTQLGARGQSSATTRCSTPNNPTAAFQAAPIRTRTWIAVP